MKVKGLFMSICVVMILEKLGMKESNQTLKLRKLTRVRKVKGTRHKCENKQWIKTKDRHTRPRSRYWLVVGPKVDGQEPIKKGRG